LANIILGDQVRLDDHTRTVIEVGRTLQGRLAGEEEIDLFGSYRGRLATQNSRFKLV
jgi:hypothetical protein